MRGGRVGTVRELARRSLQLAGKKRRGRRGRGRFALYNGRRPVLLAVSGPPGLERAARAGCELRACTRSKAPAARGR